MAKNLELTTSATTLEVKPGEVTKVVYTLTSATTEGLDVQLTMEGAPAWIRLLGPALRTLGPREVQGVDVELAPPLDAAAQVVELRLSVVAIQRPEVNWDNPPPFIVRVASPSRRPFPWLVAAVVGGLLVVGGGVGVRLACDKDPTPVDPCAATPAPCDVNATCTAAAGAPTCACKPGFTGDGKACAALPPADMVGHWSFDEGAGNKVKDASRNGFHGTHSARYVAGVKGTALSFSGQAAATIPAAPGFIWGDQGEAYTVSYWLNVPAPVGNWRSIIHKTTGANCCDAGTRNPAHFLAPQEMGIHTVHGTTANGNDAVDVKPVPTGRWFHYAETAEGGTRKNYVDGNLVLTRTVAASVGNAGTLLIGMDGFYAPLDGAVDELRVFRRALSQQELQAQIAADIAAP